VRPLTEDRDAIAEADEKEDVYGQPYDPCNQSRPVCAKRPCDARDRSLAADGRHIAFVEVVKRFLPGSSRGICYEQPYALRRIYSHLHGRLRRPGNLRSLLFYMREIADDENLGMV